MEEVCEVQGVPTDPHTPGWQRGGRGVRGERGEGPTALDMHRLEATGGDTWLLAAGLN